MARTRCCGRVDDAPPCRNFLAQPEKHPEAMRLHLEEFEAVRLKDYAGLDQAEAAQRMELSRPTFQRILRSARQKIAAALTEGRKIIIEGGHYTMAKRVFECVDCKHVWEEPPCTEGGRHGYEIPCPKCGSMKKMKLENGEGHLCGGAHSHHEHHGGHSCGCGHHQ